MRQVTPGKPLCSFNRLATTEYLGNFGRDGVAWRLKGPLSSLVSVFLARPHPPPPKKNTRTVVESFQQPCYLRPLAQKPRPLGLANVSGNCCSCTQEPEAYASVTCGCLHLEHRRPTHTCSTSTQIRTWKAKLPHVTKHYAPKWPTID